MTAAPARPLVVACPSATVELRRTETGEGVMLCVRGEVGRGDAAVLSRRLHAELDALPAVVVVDVRCVTRCEASWREVLEVVRRRSRADGVGMHVLEDDRSGVPLPHTDSDGHP